jgi:hypothetical protein
MQSVIVGVERAGALLFVRSLAQLPAALGAVSKLVAQPGWRDSPGNEVLGVVVRKALDAGLTETTCGSDRWTHASVSLRESAQLSGLWSLCWFDFTAHEGRGDAACRRTRLLDHLVSASTVRPNAGDPTSFLPVFASAEAGDGVEHLVDRLKARYPAFTIGPDCFVHDAQRRKLVRLARHLPPPKLRLLIS